MNLTFIENQKWWNKLTRQNHVCLLYDSANKYGGELPIRSQHTERTKFNMKIDTVKTKGTITAKEGRRQNIKINGQTMEHNHSYLGTIIEVNWKIELKLMDKKLIEWRINRKINPV